MAAPGRGTDTYCHEFYMTGNCLNANCQYPHKTESEVHLAKLFREFEFSNPTKGGYDSYTSEVWAERPDPILKSAPSIHE